MQCLNGSDTRQRLNSEIPNKFTLSSIRNNKIKDNIPQDIGIFCASPSDCGINFKYVSEAELQVIVKRVKRARQKKLDEEKWHNFLRQKQLEVVPVSSDDVLCAQCFEEEPGSAPLQCHLSQTQNHRKDMPKIGLEEEKLQGSHLSSTMGASNAADVGHGYQLGGVLTKRLQDLVSTVGRMTSLLLSSVTTRSVQYEDEDVDRAIKRSVEFDAMFARNHLYEIQRLLKDAKQLAAGKSPRGELETKITAALKCVTLAIQVYAKHVSKGARVKYQQVVPIFQSISTIHSLLEQLTGEHVFPFRQELEVSCSYMKQLLLEMSTTDTQSVVTVSRKPARPKPATRHKPSADLSMYSRRRADWRRKTASLARTKFGPPSGKKHGPVKDPVNAREVPNRKATRAVPEDNVTTMMEMIPNEPIEDGELCLDDKTFQALKQLNGTYPSFQQEHNTESQELLPNDLQTQTPHCRSKSTSARSVKREPNNVQLLCLREDENRRFNLSDKNSIAVDSTGISEGSHTTLTIDEDTRKEAFEYHQNMIEYHKVNSHYKEGKALGIVDRLATRILTEMVMDFQKEEMNNVIQTLYNLEFQ